MGDRRPPAARRASALRYDPAKRDHAPTLVASGQGHVADRIVAAAEHAGVPVREDPMLADALAHLQVGDEVPHDLYIAVAEVLLWAWHLDHGRTPPLR